MNVEVGWVDYNLAMALVEVGSLLLSLHNNNLADVWLFGGFTVFFVIMAWFMYRAEKRF